MGSRPVTIGDVPPGAAGEPGPATQRAARDWAARLRSPWRRAFAEQWIAYRWLGAPEPAVPDGMTAADFRRFTARLGGRREPVRGDFAQFLKGWTWAPR